MPVRFKHLLAAIAVVLPGSVAADPWKDESGHGRRTYQAPAVIVPQHRHPPAPYVATAPAIPTGHLPSPGECRVWHPGVPAGHQPPPHRC